MSRTAHWTGLLAAGGGFIVSAIAYYPGFMSPDSLTQYSASLSLSLDDWHPPIMSWVWFLLNLVFTGPQGLLFLHLLLLWGGLYAWQRNFDGLPGSWAILAIGLLPWVFNFAGTLWKDVGMAYALLLGSGIAVTRQGPWRTALALALLLYAVNLRYNAVFAVAPMLLLLVSRWRPGLSRSGRVGLSLAILAGGIAAGHVLSYQVLGASRSHPSKYMLVDDLFHLSLVRNRSLLPGVSLEHIQECAARDFGGSRLVGRAACLVREKGYRADDPAYAQLAGPWLAAILASPGDYIRFRLAAFGYLLRSPDVAPFYIWHPGIDDNGMGIIQRHNGLTVLAERLVKQTAAVAPFVFKPYFWLWVGLMLLLFTLAVKPNAYTAIQQALLVSSILYVLGYLPLTPRADLRYVYWSVLATNLAGILTVLGFSANRLRQPRLGARRNLTLVALGLGMTIAIPNARTLLHVNGDAVMLANLAAPARALHTPVGSSDLQNEGAAYRVRGPDPFLVFEVPDADSARRRVLGFRFACLNPVSEPVLQLFWWGGSESGPREEQSLFFRPQAGVNAVVFKSGEGGRVTERLRGVRIDLSTPGACGAIAITEPALYALD